jgi:hypothetical protein
VGPQSGSTPDEAVDHRGDHLALQLAQRRTLAFVEVVHEPTRGDGDLKVGQEDLEDSGQFPAELTTHHPDHEFPEPFGSIRFDGKDTSHDLASLLPPPAD